MPPREKSVLDRITDWLDALPGCEWRKRHGDVFAVSGDPDLSILWMGMHFEFEVKRPGEKARKIQAYRLKRWAQAGAVTGVVDDLADVQRIMQSARYPRTAATTQATRS